MTTPSPSTPTESAMPAARPPVGAGSAPLAAQLLALVLVGLGAVGVQEALVRTGAVAGGSWTLAAVEAVDGTTATDPVVLVAAVVLVLLGLLLLVLGLRRRPRTAVSLRATTGVYLRARDLGRIARSHLEGADAVTDLDVRATRRRLSVRATTLAGTGREKQIRAELDERLAHAVEALERPPRASVSVHREEVAS